MELREMTFIFMKEIPCGCSRDYIEIQHDEMFEKKLGRYSELFKINGTTLTILSPKSS